jgi:beta-phosphoglucomutase-like phosphatase (HAD superfamily)
VSGDKPDLKERSLDAFIFSFADQRISESTMSFIRDLEHHGIRMAVLPVGTDSSDIRKRLAGIALLDVLPVAACPQAGTFLGAAHHLDASPMDTAVVVDTAEAAQVAGTIGFGMVIALAGSRQISGPAANGVDFVVEDLGDLSLRPIEAPRE